MFSNTASTTKPKYDIRQPALHGLKACALQGTMCEFVFINDAICAIAYFEEVEVARYCLEEDTSSLQFIYPLLVTPMF